MLDTLLKLFNYAVIILFIAVAGYFVAFEIYKWSYGYQTMRQTKKIFQEEVTRFLPEYLTKLKENKNDWLLCTERGLSLKNINDPKIMAQYYLYYKYRTEYCQNWIENTIECSAIIKATYDSQSYEDKVKRSTLCYLARNDE